MPSEGIQGDEWDAYVTLDTYNRDERGIAYGARALGRRSARRCPYGCQAAVDRSVVSDVGSVMIW